MGWVVTIYAASSGIGCTVCFLHRSAKYAPSSLDPLASILFSPFYLSLRACTLGFFWYGKALLQLHSYMMSLLNVETISGSSKNLYQSAGEVWRYIFSVGLNGSQKCSISQIQTPSRSQLGIPRSWSNEDETQAVSAGRPLIVRKRWVGLRFVGWSSQRKIEDPLGGALCS